MLRQMESLYRGIIANPRFRQYGLPLVGALLGIQALRSLSGWLSQRALNHYTSNSKWDWSKELVVITGGNSGIGAKIVERLASRGVKVIILDITEAKGQLSPNISAYQVDVGDLNAVRVSCDRIRSEHGHPTVLINNAGLALDATILGISMDDVQRTFSVNLFSHYQLVKEFLPHMIENDHGHIVTVASLAAHAPRTANVAYAASKAAALAFHEGLGLELALYYDAKKRLIDNGLKVSMVEPEVVADAVLKQLYSGDSGQIVVPSSLSLATGIRGWPHWLHQMMLMDMSTSSKAATVAAMENGQQE
ncbi:hypothetical protein H2202_007234 [Exophiala xenobiotica]|nr:hypothetical protein H2202_007234 [Exophiala xenobiotica]